MLDSPIDRVCQLNVAKLLHVKRVSRECLLYTAITIIFAVVVCPPLSDPVNGAVSVPDASFGGVATYTCYALAGMHAYTAFQIRARTLLHPYAYHEVAFLGAYFRN